MVINELISRNVTEVIDVKHLEAVLRGGKKLRVKLGIDPSKPDLHIGHAVPLQKLRSFQESGHTAILLFGDYTAQLGDPSDKVETRDLLSIAETRANAKAYLKQVGQVLDLKRIEVRYNSEWYNSLSMRETIILLSKVSLNHLMSHETFVNRLNKSQPLLTHEIIYPIMQGYDSVMLKADLELGGQDQKFNCLMGRFMQRAYNQPEQDVMLFPYLHGTDGQQKMSKSLGNTINLADKSIDMYGKTMSIPDELIIEYFQLTTHLPSETIQTIQKELADSATNPRDVKMQLAREITSIYHGIASATKAEETFITQFQKGQIPDTMPEKKLKASYKTVVAALIDSGLVESASEARRLVEQGGVRFDGKVMNDPLSPIRIKKGQLIQVGKRRFVKAR